MSARLHCSLSKWVWRILSYSGRRHCKMMSSYAVRGALLGGDGIEAVAPPVLLVEKVIGIFNQPHFHRFYFSMCPSQGLARAAVERLAWSCSWVRSVTYSVSSCFFFESPYDRESWAECNEVVDAVQVTICIIPTFASGHRIVTQV